MSVRIVSWNIQKGIGVDLRRDLSRTARVLRDLSPDIVGLQEVLRVERFDQLAEIARALDMNLAWGPARSARGGAYGNALLTRGEIVSSRVHPIGVEGHEPRVCFEVRTRVSERDVRVFVCHLGLRTRERRVQIGRVLEILRAAPRDVPRIVVGDFNEWRGSIVTTSLASEFPTSPRPVPTHPSPFPILALDRMAWDAELRGTMHVANVHRASDHRALYATLT